MESTSKKRGRKPKDKDKLFEPKIMNKRGRKRKEKTDIIELDIENINEKENEKENEKKEPKKRGRKKKETVNNTNIHQQKETAIKLKKRGRKPKQETIIFSLPKELFNSISIITPIREWPYQIPS